MVPLALIGSLYYTFHTNLNLIFHIFSRFLSLFYLSNQATEHLAYKISTILVYKTLFWQFIFSILSSLKFTQII
jgi:hypothetical protein